MIAVYSVMLSISVLATFLPQNSFAGQIASGSSAIFACYWAFKLGRAYK